MRRVARSSGDERPADPLPAEGRPAEIVAIDADRPDPAILERAGALIREGGLVAFPTETVYGLGADATDDRAVRRVFEVKGRSPDDPLIVHLASPDQLGDVAVDVPGHARALAERFWPGPLTLVVPKRPIIPPSVTAGLETVAVRVPSHPVAHGLIAAAGRPVVAPSANLFTRTSATTAAHVASDLGDRIDLILDAGPAPIGIESTVVAVEGDRLTLLRPGAIAAEEIAAMLPPSTTLAPGPAGGRSASPGQMTKHYAPRARVLFVRGPAEPALDRLRRAAEQELADGRQIGLLLCDEDAARFAGLGSGAVLEPLGSCADLRTVARRLYAGLRRLDACGVDTILVRDLGREGLGLAILDRLTRAASSNVVDVGE